MIVINLKKIKINKVLRILNTIMRHSFICLISGRAHTKFQRIPQNNGQHNVDSACRPREPIR